VPSHFRPEHLGRASARFDESQLMHCQKEALQPMSIAEIRAWLGSDEPPEFIDLVRHNIVLPADAAPWAVVVHGELPPLGPAERRVVADAGPAFFSAAAEALNQTGTDLKQLTKILKERTGRKGADLFLPLRVALTGQAHGPELAPLLLLMTPGTARLTLVSHAQNP